MKVDLVSVIRLARSGRWSTAASIVASVALSSIAVSCQRDPPLLPRSDTTSASPAVESGAIAGRVLVDEGVRVGWIVAQLARSDGLADDPKRYDWYPFVEPGGIGEAELGTKKVPAGRWTLKLFCNDSFVRPTPQLAEFADVIVRPNETTRDERLAAIDLRGRLHGAQLRVIDATSKSLGSVGVRVVGDDPREPSKIDPYRIAPHEMVPLRFLTVNPLPRVEISARGHRPAIVQLRDVDEQSVTLARGLEIRVAVPPLGRELPPLASLVCELEWAGPERKFGGDPHLNELDDPWTATVDGAATVTLLAEQPVPHVLRLVLVRAANGKRATLRDDLRDFVATTLADGR